MYNKHIILVLAGLFVTTTILAQNGAPDLTLSNKKTSIEVSLGFGKTFFFGDLRTQETAQDAEGFSPNIGTNVAFAYYRSISKVPGLQLGARASFFISTPSTNDSGDKEYFFNYYHGGISAKYFYGKTVDKGLFSRVDAGFGQMTEKLRNTSEKEATHQFAIGTTLGGSLGWAFPLKSGKSVFVETYYEQSFRNGDVDGVGEKQFQSGQIAFNVGLSF